MPLFDLSFKKVKKSIGAKLYSYLKKSVSGAQDIADGHESALNVDLTTFKDRASTKETVRMLMDTNPDMSQAYTTLSNLVITGAYTVTATDVETGTIDVEATKYIQALTARLDKLPMNYLEYQPQSSFSSIAETLLKQLIANGDTGAELILGDGLVPTEIQPFSTNTLKYVQKGKRYYPEITIDSEQVALDSPTVCIVSLQQDADSPYAVSYYQAGVASTFAAEEYRNDSRRSFRKASLPRVKATIKRQELVDTLPMETRFDEKKLAAAMDQIISQIRDDLNGLQPEDAIVAFDIVEFDHLTQGNTSTHESLQTHAKLVNGNQASGLKTLPSILGRGESQSTASTETIIFLKLGEGIQGRLNEIFSQLLTIGARLAGHDVIVEFAYEKPSLRTESESESFAAMKQSRVLEQLSLGLITDEVASIQLTGKLPPEGYTPLSGTMFREGSATNDDEIENPYSNTSVSGKGVTATKNQKDSASDSGDPKTNKTTGQIWAIQ